MGANPARHILTVTRLGVDVAAGPQHADEQFYGNELAGGSVEQRRPFTGEVHEGLLPGSVNLPHAGGQLVAPSMIVSAELAIPVTGGVLLLELRTKLLEGNAGPLEFLMDPGPVRYRPDHAHQVGSAAAEQPAFQLRVVHLGRQGPAEAGGLGPLAVEGHRARPHATGLGDIPVDQPLFVLQPQDFSNLTHR